MARVKLGDLAPGVTTRSAGVFEIVDGQFGPYARKWHRKEGKAKTPYDFYKREEFAIAAAWSTDPEPVAAASAIEIAKGSQQIPRDITMAAIYGRLITFRGPEGIEWKYYRMVAPNAQLVLDQVTETVGALLYRSPVGWIEIAPGDNGQVLAMNDTTPDWQDVYPVAVAQSDMLVKTANVELPHARVVTDGASVVAAWSTPGQVTFKRAALSGDVTATLDSNALTIAAQAVTYAKLQNISATSRLLARRTSGAGSVEESTISEVLDFLGSVAQGDLAYRGASAWSRLPAGTAGQLLKTNGAAANPAWTDSPGQVDMLVKTSDAAAPNARVLTDSTSITADWATSAQVKMKRAALTGDVTASADSNALTIANQAVSYAKMQDVSTTSRVLGRVSSGAGSPEELTLSQVLDLIGSATQGDILFRGSSAWSRLGVGALGQLLKSNGASADIAWTDAPSFAGGVGQVQSPYFADSTIYLCQASGCSTSLSSIALTANVMYFFPLYVPWSRSFTSIAINIAGGGSIGGSNCRLAIYNHLPSTGGPGTVLLDAGNVTTATTGLRAITIAQDLPPGPYYLAIWPSAGITVRGVLASSSWSLTGWSLGAATPAPTPYITRSLAFGSSFPDETSQTHTLNAGNVVVPLVGIR